MESRKLKATRIIKFGLVGMVLALFGLEAYRFGEGVARHGSMGDYIDARRESSDLKLAIDVINNYYVDAPGLELDQLTESELESIVSGLDPYSAYLNAEELTSLRDETQQEFGGIGIQVEMNDRRLTVVTPIEGTPGARAGLLRGDQIVAIDGESIIGISMMEAIGLLRGVPGTEAVLTLYRPRAEREFQVSVAREVIEVENVKSVRMLDEGIGYLRILQFGSRTGQELINGVEALREQGMESLIIDLRNNPGGLLDAAVDVASPFLEPGQLVVYTEGRQRDQTDQWKVERQKARYDFPLVLLVNEGSASAAEIVAGALKDWGRAALVGEKTFGKGSVQSIIALGERAGLRLTTAKYYTPGGYVIEKQGVEPDLTVETTIGEDRKLAIQRSRLDFMPDEEFTAEFDFEPIEDRQLEAAAQLLRSSR